METIYSIIKQIKYYYSLLDNNNILNYSDKIMNNINFMLLATSFLILIIGIKFFIKSLITSTSFCTKGYQVIFLVIMTMIFIYISINIGLKANINTHYYEYEIYKKSHRIANTENPYTFYPTLKLIFWYCLGFFTLIYSFLWKVIKKKNFYKKMAKIREKNYRKVWGKTR